MSLNNKIQKIVSDETFDLSKGIDELIKGIKLQHPELSHGEVRAMADALLKEAGKALGNGERLASIKLKEDGNFDINIWHIGPRKSD